MKRHLITGGAGFIGSHLAEALLARGDAVEVLDDFSTGRRENLAAFERDERFRLTVGGVTDPAAVASAIERNDDVYHLAAAVGVRLIVTDPARTIQTNIRGAEVVLEAAARTKKKVFIASSSEVYGKGVRIPLAETHDLLLGPTTCPRWAYACSKAIDEFLALAYAKQFDLPVVIARFFNTVGPRQSGQYGMVIPRFLRQGLAGEPITVYGDGRQTRCFAHVRDTVRAAMELMDREACRGQVFNVGGDSEISILELARRVVELTGGRSRIRRIPFEEAYGPGFEDMERRVPDLARLRRSIDWTNLAGIDEILRSTMEWMREEADTRTAS
jgi:UDP-glucose 4-epimerase